MKVWILLYCFRIVFIIYIINLGFVNLDSIFVFIGEMGEGRVEEGRGGEGRRRKERKGGIEGRKR